MKLATFSVRTAVGRFTRLGAVTDRGVCDLHAACVWYQSQLGVPNPDRFSAALVPPDLLGLLRGGMLSLTTARESLEAVADVSEGIHEEQLWHAPGTFRWETPLPQPPSVRDFYAFEQHVKAGFTRRQEPMPEEWYQLPVYYQTGHHHLIGTEQDVLWPSFTERFDYELELAAVIGRRGRNVKAAEAAGYIAGFTIMNDFSARDIQRREMKVRLGPAKGKHWCTGLGPWLVTADEIGDPYKLRMTARVNGETWSEGHSGDLFWRFEQMIEFLTQDDFIQPGDIIGSGTVGTGCGLELDRWVQPGDTIELEIEKIGVLRNRVVRSA